MPADFETQTQTQTDTEQTEVSVLPVIKTKKKLPKWLKIILILILLAGGMMVALFSCAKQAVASAVFYEPNEVVYRDIEVKVSDSGTVLPADSYTVTALVTGEVLDASFEEGDLVEKDAPLYTIDSGDLDYQIERAELTLQQAQIQYNNTVTSLTPMTTAAGRVQMLMVDVGDTVAPGTPIATILASDEMKLIVPFHSADVALFAVGQSATLTLDGTMEQLTGTITDIGWDDVAGTGGAILRMVEISVANPGGLSTSNVATASVGACYSVTSGALQEGKSRTVVATSSGTITQLLVNEGDWVGADVALCRIGGQTAEATLENASISLKNAEISLQSTLDMLDNYNITAPISGTVIDKKVKVGDNVEQTTGPLVVIYDMSYLEFTLNVHELDVTKIKAGQTVRITSQAVGDQAFTGVVDKVSINGTTMNGVTTYPVTIIVDEAGDLLPGMNVSADIMVETMPHVLSIPVEAVSRGNTVQVVPADGYDKEGNVDPAKLQTVNVELGLSDEDYIQVLSGLEEGQTVVSISAMTNLMETMMQMNGGMSGGMPPMGGMG